MVIASFPELKAHLHELPPKAAVVAAAHDEHTLQAVFAARRVGLIRPILVGREEEIRALAQWLAGISRDIPLHLSRFFPSYQMTDRPPTSVEQVYRLAEEAREHLSYVYTGNC